MEKKARKTAFNSQEKSFLPAQIYDFELFVRSFVVLWCCCEFGAVQWGLTD